ncbi:hypothetical protein [Streptomyces sp. SID14478]|uniref:hypothetical protein n=1 Tax=Streptomyces sp. SID14478 TaxID=2706073 RepID=UPI001EF25844|nr:hypothetical protein [Streptomyces sp. SID14478]
MPEARDAWGTFKRRLNEEVTDLAAFGQIKAPATDVPMGTAELWGDAHGWAPPPA